MKQLKNPFVISARWVRKILAGLNIRPHKHQYWLFSKDKTKDPLFDLRVQRVCSVYLDAVESSRYRLVMDNLNTHYSESMVRMIAGLIGYEDDLGKKGVRGILKSTTTRRDFLSDPSKSITCVYTPRHCSWLNQIEMWFGTLSRKVIHRGSFDSLEYLQEQILAFIEYYNKNLAHPYHWTHSGRILTAWETGKKIALKQYWLMPRPLASCRSRGWRVMERLCQLMALSVFALFVVSSDCGVFAADPMEASIRAKADRPWFAKFMVGEPVVAGFPGESEADRIKRVKPWADAKFGLFLHWGPQRSGGEYVIKPADLKKFNPVKFDAEEWVLTAKDLGFRYMVITTKHHAGFCMFDSAYTDHDIIDATPFGRDPIKELADACEKHGMLLGFYYSVWDIKHPDYSKNIGNPNYARYQQYMLDQTAELLTEYGPVATLWMDGEWVNTWTYERASEYRDQVRMLQPNIMLVDRIGQRRLGDGDYGSSETFTPYIGDNINGRLWETCQRFDGQWFYTGRDNSQSVQWALRNLIDTVSRGGNLLLNMGPTPEGLLPPQSVKKLRPLGAWLRKHGEAIYGVERGPHYLIDWGACSRRGNTLYYFIADWPSDGMLVIPGLHAGRKNAGIKQLSFLGESVGAPVSFRQTGKGVTVSLPGSSVDPLMSVLKVELDGPPVVDNTIRPLGAPLRPQKGNANVTAGDYFLSSAFANIHGEKLHFSLGTGAGAQRENLKGWTEESDWVHWEITTDKSRTYEVQVNYCSWMNSGKFVVEIAGESFEHTVVASKAPRKRSPLIAAFQTVTVGEVTLVPGEHKVAVKAVEIDAKAKEYDVGLMMLREVILGVKK